VVNDSTAVGRMIVEQLLTAGMQHAVLAPGSRSAPLALALSQAADVGRITLHTRIDERDAGFLALGLAKASGQIVPVLVTSGSAVANLAPAMVEAFYSSVPVLALTADRPATHRTTNAPQTINQVGIFANFVVGEVDLVPSLSDSATADVWALLERMTGQLTAMQQGSDVSTDLAMGPGHLNVQFDMPLMPDGADLEWVPHAGGSAEATRESPVTQAHNVATNTSAVETAAMLTLELPPHGLMVIGDLSDQGIASHAAHLAHELGWPIVWEPTSQAHTYFNALSHGSLLLASGKLPTPDAVITVGTVGLSRSVLGILGSVKRHIAVQLPSASGVQADPALTATQILDVIPNATTIVDPQWLAEWQEADAKASEIVQSTLAGQALNGPMAALTLWNYARDEDQLMVAASWSVRHLEAYAPTRSGLRTFGNRGANGIDGLISTAWGIATCGKQRTYLLMGDIAFLHDIGGLNVAEAVRPNLTVVVLDNDGSGIFSQLEQAQPAYRSHYEKIFGTPHGQDLWVIAEAFGFATARVTTQDELTRTLERTHNIPGVHIIICNTGTRVDEAQLINQIVNELKDIL